MDKIYIKGVLRINRSFNAKGQINGDCTIYRPDGTRCEVIRYCNGKRHGDCTLYRPDGTRSEVVPYHNDKREGWGYEYTPSGLYPYRTITYRNDRLKRVS